MLFVVRVVFPGSKAYANCRCVQWISIKEKVWVNSNDIGSAPDDTCGELPETDKPASDESGLLQARPAKVDRHLLNRSGNVVGSTAWLIGI